MSPPTDTSTEAVHVLVLRDPNAKWTRLVEWLLLAIAFLLFVLLLVHKHR